VEHGSKAVLYDDADLQVGAALFQEMNRRSAKNAVAERSQPDDYDIRVRPDTVEDRRHRLRGLLLFDPRFVDQHHRDFIPDRINPLALRALKTALVRFEVKSGFAKRTDEDIQ
jgi:hypothetical protein